MTAEQLLNRSRHHSVEGHRISDEHLPHGVTPSRMVESVLEALQDGIIEFDPRKRRHLYVNSAFCRLSGVDPFSVFETPWPGPWWSSTTHDRLDAMAHRLSEHLPGYAEELEGELVRADRSVVPVNIKMASAVSSTGSEPKVFGVISVRDRTHEQVREREFDRLASKVLLAEERERIARDLHDNAIQRLFATGLHLQGSLHRPDVEQRVSDAIDEIDDIIREIRSTIFTLHRPRPLLEGAEHALRSTVAEASRLLGHAPDVDVAGDLDTVPANLVGELLSVVREVLSNVAKHANSSSSSVVVSIDDSHLQLDVEDDGIGFDVTATNAGNGLANLMSRARNHGGDATITSRDPWGTRVRWRVPLH